VIFFKIKYIEQKIKYIEQKVIFYFVEIKTLRKEGLCYHIILFQ
jgi:hypothetical protein